MTDPLRQADSDGRRLTRRTVLFGAAWTLPAIAAATTAPAATASVAATLSFDKTGYVGDTCAAITGITVTATSSGAPAAGLQITISLSTGYTFVGGSNSVSGYSGSNGTFSVPDIRLDGSGTSGTVTASGGGSTKSATLSAIGYGFVDKTNVYHPSVAGLPANSKPAPGGLLLTPAGDLIPSDGSPAVRTGVASFGSASQGWWAVANTDGTYGYIDDNNAYHAALAGLPANCRPAPGGLLLTPGGSLISSVTGATLRTGVASFGAASLGWWTIVNTDGTYGYMDAATTYHAGAAGLPANCTPAPGGLLLTPSGNLISAGGGSPFRTGVAAFGSPSQGSWALANTDGTYGYVDSSNTYRAGVSGLPANSTPATGVYVLAPDGRLISVVNGSVLASGVASTGTESLGWWTLAHTSTC
ncbi:hypothetical protein [Microbacterium sp. SLBN-111]|uniref:hypothetical protein n=1 Tax=Microbacterium sp. SLBN-111 TaxID=3377733 RepID=UPI003C75DBB6